ncbi:hypothetical protein AGMMS49574_27920 [Bacteroidia bacterium]|nr:hypothetical protein AGMMS49574_27920 [Bacteroidia bacterium]
MRSRIETLLPKDKHRIENLNYEEVYIADWKDVDSTRGVEATSYPPEINSVCLHNNNQVHIVFDAFADNALPINKGVHNKQCECVLFPLANDDCNWVLFIETKYARNSEFAFRKEHDYPSCMVNQIIETVDYFRRRSIIEENRLVHALVSFPNLADDYNDRLFDALEGSELSVDSIKLKYKIAIRGSNSAIVISDKRIKLKGDS